MNQMREQGLGADFLAVMMRDPEHSLRDRFLAFSHMAARIYNVYYLANQTSPD